MASTNANAENVTNLKATKDEETVTEPTKFQTIKAHPATKRVLRNTMRAGIIGLGYTIMDEGFNRTSFENANERVAVLYVPKKA